MKYCAFCGAPIEKGKRCTCTDAIANLGEDYNEDWCYYKSRAHELLKQGIPGFIIGFLLTIVPYFIFLFSSGSDLSIGWFLFLAMLFIISALFAGIGYAGFPYGWRTLNRFLGQWAIFGNILVILLLFVFKIVIAFSIGCVAYPIVLIYNLIRSQESKRRARLWTIIAISIVLISFVLVAVTVIGWESDENDDPALRPSYSNPYIDDNSTSFPQHNSTGPSHSAETTVSTEPKVTFTLFADNSDCLKMQSEAETLILSSKWIPYDIPGEWTPTTAEYLGYVITADIGISCDIHVVYKVAVVNPDATESMTVYAKTSLYGMYPEDSGAEVYSWYWGDVSWRTSMCDWFTGVSMVDDVLETSFSDEELAELFG